MAKIKAIRLTQKQLRYRLEKFRLSQKIYKIKFWDDVKCKVVWGFIPIGFALFKEKQISMNPKITNQRQYNVTMLHEMAHVMLKHEGSQLFKARYYRKEVEAESVVKEVLKHFGYDIKPQNKYISRNRHGLRRHSKTIQPKMTKVHKVAQKIIKAIE